MLISLNWLKQYVDIKVDVPTLADRLTLAGNEVERIAQQEVNFDGVVVAEVESLRSLPGSVKNQVAGVTTGGGKVVEVVTGAWNLAVGDRVPYATPGARLGDRRIETRTFLGFPSAGMLCSAIELGLGEDAAGIMVLDPGAGPGSPRALSARHHPRARDQVEPPGSSLSSRHRERGWRHLQSPGARAEDL